jgi:uncharacterized protein (DUF427 family)
MKALWNNAIIAESDETITVEGNCYFPTDSVNGQFLHKSETHTTCPWKGKASYYDVVVGDAINRDAAWYYPDPKPKAMNIKNHVAFWHGIQVVD